MRRLAVVALVAACGGTPEPCHGYPELPADRVMQCLVNECGLADLSFAETRCTQVTPVQTSEDCSIVASYRCAQLDLIVVYTADGAGLFEYRGANGCRTSYTLASPGIDCE